MILPHHSVRLRSAVVPRVFSLGLGSLRLLAHVQRSFAILPLFPSLCTSSLCLRHLYITKFWVFSFLALYYLVDRIFLLNFFNLVFWICGMGFYYYCATMLNERHSVK